MVWLDLGVRRVGSVGCLGSSWIFTSNAKDSFFERDAVGVQVRSLLLGVLERAEAREEDIGLVDFPVASMC